MGNHCLNCHFAIVRCCIPLEMSTLLLGLCNRCRTLGQFGDFIGGSLGIILTFLSIILLYKTFEAQREANRLTKSSNEQINEENTTLLCRKRRNGGQKTAVVGSLSANALTKPAKRFTINGTGQRNHSFFSARPSTIPYGNNAPPLRGGGFPFREQRCGGC